jgi:hypothetical protein
LCLPCHSLRRSFLPLVDALPATPLAASLDSFTRRCHARRAARCIARFFRWSTSCPPRRSLRRSFLSLVDVLPAAPLAASFVSFARRYLARRPARCIARFFLLPTCCPPHRSLYRLFRTCPSRRVLHRSFLSLADDMPDAPLAASLVSSACQRFALRSARYIACFVHSTTSFPPRLSLRRSFLSLVDVLSAAPLGRFVHLSTADCAYPQSPRVR